MPEKKIQRRGLIGYAVLKKDSLTGVKAWVSWDGDGADERTFDEKQPLVFPPDTLQIGTRVHLLPPEE